jgi:hypothetical protein
VEIKDLFKFAHLQAGEIKVEEIEKLLEGADEEKKTDHHEDSAGGGAVKANLVEVFNVTMYSQQINKEEIS